MTELTTSDEAINDSFFPLGEPYALVGGGWRGDLVGLYTFNNQGDSGWIDVAAFDYRF